jgi:hypothetical protein
MFVAVPGLALPMRLLQLSPVVAIAFATVAHAQGVTPPYVAELKRQCPAQRLENLTAGDLELLMEGFEPHLTPAQLRQQQDAVGARCARVEAGLSCGNAATLETYKKLGLLKDFTHAACASGWTCKSFLDCTRPKP